MIEPRRNADSPAARAGTSRAQGGRRTAPRLVSHVNGDGDLLQAWLDHYLGLGVGSFHLIVHGPREENERLFTLAAWYPIVIEETYEGEFHTEEKRRRINALLARMRGQWIVLVDSDEFLELPYSGLRTTIRVMTLLGANALAAPMVQRVALGGGLESPAIIDDPFRSFPLCTVDLYERMGVTAQTSKFPLFWCADFTVIRQGGNHGRPNGERTVLSPALQGVTHHFKWRRTVTERLLRRAESAHTFRHESIGFHAYLAEHGGRVPVEGAFPYSRNELMRRGLLRTITPRSLLYRAGRRTLRLLRPGRSDGRRHHGRG